MRVILNWIYKRYGYKIYIFENGAAVPKENDLPLSAALHDTFRVDFYKSYIQAMKDAVTLDGVEVEGYFEWSWMDNFEWEDGYKIRFGMTYVDFTNN